MTDPVFFRQVSSDDIRLEHFTCVFCNELLGKVDQKLLIGHRVNGVGLASPKGGYHIFHRACVMPFLEGNEEPFCPSCAVAATPAGPVNDADVRIQSHVQQILGSEQKEPNPFASAAEVLKDSPRDLDNLLVLFSDESSGDPGNPDFRAQELENFVDDEEAQIQSALVDTAKRIASQPDPLQESKRYQEIASAFEANPEAVLNEDLTWVSIYALSNGADISVVKAFAKQGGEDSLAVLVNFMLNPSNQIEPSVLAQFFD